MSFYQPYQEASQEFQRQSTAPTRNLKTAANIGVGLATGSTLLNRAVPFFSKFIPQGMALKGLSKINPMLGKFISASENQGFEPQEVLDFVEEKVKEGIGQQEAKDERNPIQKHNDQLHEFILNNIKRGVSPVEAATKAKERGSPNFKKSIADIEKEYKTDFISLVEQIFGQGTQKTNASDSMLSRMLQPAETPEQNAMANQVANQLMGQQGGLQPQQQPNAPQPMQGQGQSGGQGEQRLLAAIDQLRKLRGG